MRVWDEVDYCYREITVEWNGAMDRQDEALHSLLSGKRWSAGGGYAQREKPHVSNMSREKHTLPSQKDIRKIQQPATVNPWATASERRQRVFGRCRSCGKSVNDQQLRNVRRFCGRCRLSKGKPKSDGSQLWTWCQYCHAKFNQAAIIKKRASCEPGKGCKRFVKRAVSDQRDRIMVMLKDQVRP